MPHKTLEHKPLAEAIFELRWKLSKEPNGVMRDPNYKILIGRLYDRISEDYGDHVELPAAGLPEVMAAYVVQRQFRSRGGPWPLVQLGPGVVTLNETSKYTWADFSCRIESLLRAMFSAYPDSTHSLVPVQILLRYLDAHTLDDSGTDTLAFLKEKLKTNIEPPGSLFLDTGVDPSPVALNVKLGFRTTKPEGSVSISLDLAERTEDKARTILSDTMVMTLPTAVPQQVDEIKNWIADAHQLASDWFFKMINGELERRYE